MMVIQKFRENYHGRDFVLGDLHGCYDLLVAEMKKVDFDKSKDRIFAVGDLVDRGPESLKCLSLVFENWFHSVLGNHCEMMFNGVLESSMGEFQCWMQNGGTWALDFIEMNHVDQTFVDTLMACQSVMPLAFQIDTNSGETIGVLHGDAPEFWNEALIRDCRMKTLWGRDRIAAKNSRPVKDIDKVFVGHTPVQGIQQFGNVYYIDTGGVFNNDLTLLEI
jgi:serine/threonine protein phosphatase 1